MKTARWLRMQLAGVVALAVMLGVYVVGRLPEATPDQRAELASAYRFTPRTIQLPAGLPQHEIRQVNQDYTHIDAWISSVGAGIAMNDLDADGLPNDLCLVDPRTDAVSITPAPDERAGRYAPFALSHGTLPMSSVTAPMGCTPADVNEDGRMDLVVYYWGRTPILFLGQGGPGAPLAAGSYRPVELVPGVGDDSYVGPQWNSNAVAAADFDGDGHLDLYLGNYFPDGPVLDPSVAGGVAMNDSLSNASNGGLDHLFRFTGVAADGTPSFQRIDDALPAELSKGWVLGAGAADADGDQLPELYLAQDHGRDALLHNRSTPGQIRFEPVYTDRTQALTPKSKRVGVDSFKGMAVDWGDLNRDGLYDMFVSNITTSWGIQESNLQFMATAGSRDELRADLSQGRAPYADESTATGTAWSGWAWDVKMGDFTNSGQLAIAQATGFVRGEVNRWPQLQELATSNDLTVHDPAWWPNLRSGDDLAGDQRLAFFAPAGDGTFVDLAAELGLDVPVPTRGIATGDTDGDGRLDMAVARQWDQPVFYRNEAPAAGNSLQLALQHADAPGSPVVGAEVTVMNPDGTCVRSFVDGGSGHSGKRSSEVQIGLGERTGPVDVRVTWRDREGAVHGSDLRLVPGRHQLLLGSDVDVR